MKKSFAFSLVAILIAGCGGGGGGGGAVPSAQDDLEFDKFGNGVSGTVAFQTSVIGNETQSYQITDIKANGCEGEASFPLSPFTLTETDPQQDIPISISFPDGCITDKVTLYYNAFGPDNTPFAQTKTIINPDYDATSVSKQLDDDPLFQYQWHLDNTGQSIGVVTPATPGEDINVVPVWDDGITGDGVTVAVIDEGVDMFHPDLKSNILSNLSYNYHNATKNPTPKRTVWSPSGGGYYDHPHGTAVAGLIAAKGWNGIGSRGVAPNANLISLNALEVYADEAQELYDNNEIPYLLDNAGLQAHRLYDALVRNLPYTDIYSNSWGESSISLLNDFPSYLDFDTQLRYGVTNGRNGKGSIYIKSAGNSRGCVTSFDDVVVCAMDNFETMQTNGYFIVVGASDADGTYSGYSTPGSAQLINAPGGSSASYYTKTIDHMIVSTDMAGKDRGYDSEIPKETSVGHFSVIGNENYDYTQYMNGTSAAAPIVSGVVALMLEANPDLTWRDVQIILARTATKNDPSHFGWRTNGAGMHYSNDYGFGRVNAEAAVTMARNFTSVGGTLDQTSIFTGNGSWIASSSGSASSTTTVSENITIEHVTVTLTIEPDEGEDTRYTTQTFTGSGDATRGPVMLNSGTNRVRFTTVSDVNQSSSLSYGTGAFGEENTALFTNVEGNTTEEEFLDIATAAEYNFYVESNATSWRIDVTTPIPASLARHARITLISPSGTRSVLVEAPIA